MKKPLNILILLSLLISIATLGFTFKAAFFNPKNIPINEDLENKLISYQMQKGENPAFIVEGLTINLSQQTNIERIKYLKLDAHVIPFNVQDLDLLTDKKFIVHDSIIATASIMPADELNSILGKILLESRIKRKINEELERNVVKTILFQNFIIQ